jgi:hypothetical protein
MPAGEHGPEVHMAENTNEPTGGTNDDEEARRARAARLREQIAAIKAGKLPPAAPSNPRDFIHRKMAEKQQQKDAPAAQNDDEK